MKRFFSLAVVVLSLFPALCWGQVSGPFTKECKGGKYGVYDSKGKEIIPCKYDLILTSQLKEQTSCGVKLNGKWGVYDIEKQREIIPCKYDNVSSSQRKEQTSCGVKLNGKWGVYDVVKQREIIPCKYDDVSVKQLKEPPSYNVKLDGKWGVYDIEKQREIIPCKYDDVFSSQLKEQTSCGVKLNGKYGVYDIEKQRELIPCKYDDISVKQLKEPPSYKVKLDGKLGVYDIEKQREIIPCKYDDVSSSQLKEQTSCEVKLNGKYGVYDIEKQREIIPCKYDDVSSSQLKEQTSCDVILNGKYGVYDIEKQREIIPCKYDDVFALQLREITCCKVELNGKYGVYDVEKQREIIPCKYDNITMYHGQPSYKVKLDGKCGVYDIEKQRELIPCKYDDISVNELRKQTYCEVTLNGKSGVYDVVKQREIIPCKYDEICSWDLKERTYCGVKLNGKWGLYDVVKQRGIMPCKYDNLYSYYPSDADVCQVQINDKRGVYDVVKQREIIPANKYERIVLRKKEENGPYVAAFVESGAAIKAQYVENGHFHFDEYINSGKWGVVDMFTEKAIIPCKYDGIEISDEGLYTFNIGGKQPQTISENHAIAQGGKWGVVDANNNILIPAEYDYPIVFTDGVAQVSKDGVSSFLPHPHKSSSLILANGTQKSEVDTNIPQTDKKNAETFAFIIANENYTHYTGADFSINDGKVFAEYCKKTLGLPEHNVRYFEDATYGNLLSAIKKMENIASVYDGDATIIFYYSGLGAVDNQSRERYILPTDASINTLESTGYSVQQLIEKLNSIQAKSTLALLDAPFTGMDKKGNPLIKNRGVMISPVPNQVSGSTIVCFSNGNNENSYASNKYGHGLFTYGLLKRMQETKGNCPWKELLNSVPDLVKKASLSEFDKIQTPTVIAP